MVYVTHNLAVVATVCDRVGVMYAGELVEDAPVRELLAPPAPVHARSDLGRPVDRGAAPQPGRRPTRAAQEERAAGRLPLRAPLRLR